MAAKPEQEPSIEEILASIRQIISDDDQPREADIDLSAGPEEKFEIPVAQPVANDEPKASFADVLELTNEIQEPEADPFDAVSVEPEPAPAPAPEPKEEAPVFSIPDPEPIPAPRSEPVQAQAPSKAQDTDSIFGNIAAAATTQAFSKLVGNIPVEREDNRTMYADGRVTLEDMTRDLMRPMLREWIDANVPAIVERLVEKELEKLARQAQAD